MTTNPVDHIDHIEHIEDLVFSLGVKKTVCVLRTVAWDAFDRKNVSLKYDGSPSFVMGRRLDGTPYVATKSIFNKTPVYHYEVEGSTLPKATHDAFALLLEYADEHLLPGTAVQGDIMWTQNDGTEYACENIIHYRRESDADICVALHTWYKGFPGTLRMIDAQRALPSTKRIRVVGTSVDFIDEAIERVIERSTMPIKEACLPEDLAMFVRAWVKSGSDLSFARWLIADREKKLSLFKSTKRQDAVRTQYRRLVDWAGDYYDEIDTVVKGYEHVVDLKSRLLEAIASAELSPYTYVVALKQFVPFIHEGLVWRNGTRVVKLVDNHMKRLLKTSPYSKQVRSNQ